MEPVSTIIGFIGFSAAVVNFLLTSISNVARTYRELKGTEEWYRGSFALLSEAEEILKQWKKLWIEPNRPDETYSEIWGHRGYQDVQRRLSDIRVYSQRISNILRLEDQKEKREDRKEEKDIKGKKKETEDKEKSGGRGWIRQIERFFKRGSPSPAPQKPAPRRQDVHDSESDWKTVLNEIERNVTPQQLRINVLQRIAFALYRDKELEEQTTKLKNLITTLEAHSVRLFKNTGHWWKNADLDVSDINQSLRYNETIAVAEGLKNICSKEQSSGQWAVELSDTEQRPDLNVSDLQRMNLLSFTVVFPRSTSNGLRAKRVSVTTTTRSVISGTQIADSVEVAVERVLNQPRTAYQMPNGLAVVLDEQKSPSSWKPSFDKRLLELQQDPDQRKLMERETAAVVHSLVLRVIVLWSTGWMINLCSCGLREYVIDGDHKVYAFRTYCRDTQQRLNCQRGYQPQYRLLLLGIMLSELVLARPLPLEYLTGAMPSLIGGEPLYDIVQRVKTVGGEQIAEAIDFCFTNSPKYDRGRLADTQVKELIKEIMNPVTRYAGIKLGQPLSAAPAPSIPYLNFITTLKDIFISNRDHTEWPDLLESCQSKFAGDQI